MCFSTNEAPPAPDLQMDRVLSWVASKGVGQNMSDPAKHEEESEFRCYGELETPLIAVSTAGSRLSNEDKVMKLREEIVGSMAKFTTPYGLKPVVYADWTASGRCVSTIEEYVQSTVLPFYGNTHTTTSITGHQSTCFRHEARQIIAEACNAKITGKAAEDVVLFCGNGTTACVNKLVSILGLNAPFVGGMDETYQPIVFTSSYEHHSNLLPWRESAAKVVTIAFDTATGVCLADLKAQLIKYKHHIVKIGAFSAASNVTGVLTNVDAVSVLLHQHQAVACFDYATAAPYVKMDMNPVLLAADGNSRLAHKDAIFFSGHKFLGGPSASGVLVVKRSLLPTKADLPGSQVGGGTVFYVTEEHHRYLSNREEREEGGTPMVVSDIRAGLAMHLKRSVGQQWIEDKEFEIAAHVSQRLRTSPQVVVLGSDATGVAAEAKKLPIFSFLVQCGDKFLHFHFVAVLLNDLFGVQARGGCMCAGPYAQRLLQLSAESVAQFEGAMLDKHEVLRPGFTRVSLPFWMSAAEIDYIVNSILFVAEHGWKYLPQYRYNYKTGEWAHTTRLTRFPERLWMSKLDMFAPRPNIANSMQATDAVETRPSALTMRQIMRTDWPSYSNDEALMQDIASSVRRDLHKMEQTKEFKKQVGPGAGTTTAAAAEAGYSLQGYEHLRWFLVADDLKRRGFEAANLSSLSCPVLPNLRSVEVGVAEQKADFTAYAKMRNELIQPRSGEEELVPRYLQLACKSEQERQGFLDVLRRNAFKYMQLTSKLAAAPTTAAPTVLVAPSPAAAPATQEAGGTSNEEVMDCSTGTCTLRTRPPPPTQTLIPTPGAPILTSTGKILSGPGATFSPALEKSLSVFKFHPPPKKIMKLVGQAVKEWNMIEEGDRLLLGLSGGKDSLAMLHVLHALQKRAPVKFTFACATVDPQTESFDPSPLIPYVQGLGITYHYLSEPIVQLASSKLQGDSLCAFCSRFKRGLLYSCCRTNKYNKLVLAQHLDDLVESFMMSCLHNGQLRTMKANYTIEAGDVRVIRPFAYVREASTRDFSQSVQLPIINENCPACFEQPKERARMKKLMEQEEAMVPALFHNMRKALLPMLHDDFYVTTKRIQEGLEAAGTKPGARVSSKRVKDEKDAEETVDSVEEAKRARTEEGEKTAAEILQDVLQNKNSTCEDGYCAPCFELA